MPAVRYLDLPVRHPSTDTLLRELVGQPGTVVLPGTTVPASIAEDKNGEFPIPGATLTVSDDLRLPVFWDIEGNLELDFVSGEYRLPLVSPAGLQSSAQEAAASALSAANSADAARQAAEDAAAGASSPTDEAVAMALSTPESQAAAALRAQITTTAALPPAPSDHVVYVTTNGDDESSGRSWGAAKRTIQAAVDVLEGSPGHISLAPGVYSEPTIVPTNDLIIAGSGYGFYSVGADGASIIQQQDDSTVFDMNGRRRIVLRDLTIRGSGNGEAIDASTAEVNSLHMERVKIYGFRVAFNGANGDPSSNFVMRDCVVRQCHHGVRFLRDSIIVNSVFSGNRNRAIHLNNGQIRLLGNFLEWQRDIDGNKRSDAIYLGPNANEVLIAENMFDRNTGYDVCIDQRGGGSSRPDRILIANNMLKGPGWATDIPRDERYAIGYSGSINRVMVTGNLVQRRTSAPSALKGVHAPHALIGRVGYSGSIQNLTLVGNDTTELDTPVSAGTAWAPVAGASEHHLQYQDGDVSPDEPTVLYVGGVALSRGTAGSLSHGQWGYGAGGDRDTVRVRLAGDTDPAGQEALLVYDVPIVPDTLRTVAQTETSLGGWVTSNLSAGQSQVLPSRVTTVHPGTYSVTPMLVDVWVYRTASIYGWATIPVLLRRAGNPGVSVELGTPTVHHGGASVGGPGSGATVEVSFTAADYGATLVPTVKNAHPSASQRMSLSMRRPI